MGTRGFEDVYDPDTQMELTTSFADIGNAIDLGGSDDVTIGIDIIPAGGLTTVTLSFELDDYPLMRINAAGDALELEEVEYPVSLGNKFAFPFNAKGAKMLQIKAKGNVAAGFVESLAVAKDGTDNVTPTS